MAKGTPREDWPRTVAEFEVWHARQPERWEFLSGQPRLMAPASLAHTLIKGNVYALPRDALQGQPCQVLVDGAQILTDDISAIPDAIVTSAPLDLTTPAIAERRSSSKSYRLLAKPTIRPSSGSPTGRVPAFDTIWSVSQEERVVLVHSRAGDLWHERFVTAGAPSNSTTRGSESRSTTSTP